MSEGVQIECRNMWKVFGENPSEFMKKHNGAPSAEALKEEGYIGAVRDVSFDVHAGEILIIMGLSGSGKSTVIRCITRLNDPTTGQINFEGRDLLAADDKEMIEIRRHKMGMVFQNFELIEYLKLLDNILLPCRIAASVKLTQELNARAKTLAAQCGLSDKLQRFPQGLSQGERQRTAICRALLIGPKVILADEPTGNLDPATSDEIMHLLRELSVKHDVAVLFATHDYRVVEAFPARIIRCRDGRLVEEEGIAS